jgi:hypothetical protein
VCVCLLSQYVAQYVNLGCRIMCCGCRIMFCGCRIMFCGSVALCSVAVALCSVALSHYVPLLSHYVEHYVWGVRTMCSIMGRVLHGLELFVCECCKSRIMWRTMFL